MTGSLRRPRGQSCRGAALIIALAALVLVSGIVLSFFSLTLLHRQSSFGSSGQNRTGVLMHTVLDTVLADFQAEIAAGSSTDPKYTVGGVTIYVPTTNATAAPYRTVVDPNLFNLITVSTGGTKLWPATSGVYASAGYARASTDASYPTTKPSLSGHYVPLSRWYNAQMIPTANTATFPVPNWILMMRRGAATDGTALPTFAQMSDSSPNNLNFVVGRYAYAVYDEGGLLDVNVAGNGLTPAQNAQRGRMVQAALSQLPLQDTNPGSSMNSTAATALINWRSATTQSNTAVLFDPTNNFLQVAKPATSSTTADQLFVSRQDLINYSKVNPTVLNAQALPYLATFTRELNAPCYTPDPNRAKVQAIDPNSTSYVFTYPTGNTDPSHSFGVGNPNAIGLDDTFNPSLANFRDTDNRPILRQRFPLNRLAWLTYRGPMADSSGNLNPLSDSVVAAEITAYNNAGISTTFLKQGTAANIQTYFGLAWVSTAGSEHWVYTSPEPPAGGAPAKAINPFSSIPTTRKTGPDFFETLKAAILVGSLGRDAGPAGPHHWPTPNQPISGVASNVLLADQNIDRQILQIGANIEDQFDLDSFPTTITMGTSGGTTTVYGVEGLPYLTRLSSLCVQNYTTDKLDGYLAPELWNPYQTSVSPPIANSTPTQFRFRAVGDPDNPEDSTKACYTSIGTGIQYGQSVTGATAYAITGDAPITFSAAAGSFATPTLLKPGNSSGGLPASGSQTAWYSLYPGNLSVNTATLYGLYAGSIDMTATSASSTVVPTSYPNSLDTGYTTKHYSAQVTPIILPNINLNSFVLEYSANGSWYPYSVVRNIAYRDGAYIGYSSVLIKSGGDGVFRGWTYEDVHIDPRTDRFGVMGKYSGAGQSAEYDPFLSETLWFTPQTPVPSTSTPPPQWNGENVYTPLDSRIIWQRGSNPPNPNPGQANSAFTMQSQNNGTGAAQNSLIFLPSSAGTYASGRYMETLADNIGGTFATAHSLTASLNYYADPDGVVRPAAGAYNDNNSTNGAGRPMAMTAAGGSMLNATHATISSQPIVLNRPFRSVGELGYTFRDLPWKDLDFFTSVSGDAGLLEAFSINDTSAAVKAGNFPLVAGTIDLNTRNTLALQALLYGAVRNDFLTDSTNVISQADTTAIAQALVTRTTSATTGQGPLQSKADLVLKFSDDLSTAISTSTDRIVKSRREAPIRALADAGNVRTWNLLIDLVVQAGKYPTSAQNGSQFAVEGEKHYWVHVALDRYTGQVVDQQIELVND